VTGFLDPTHLVNTVGLVGIMAILFAESGLLVGFFLPGDSLLFTAGLLVAGGLVAPLRLLLFLLPLAAVAGNLAGWWIGRRAGPAVLDRAEPRLFKARHVDRARTFFERNGARTVIRARFVPVVGYWLGQVTLVRDHVELFIVGIVALSLVPVAIEALRSRQAA
jgi:membrane-associated protein